MDIWTEKLVRRHLPILERWLDRSAGEITPNDLPSDAHELESWFDMCAAEPERLDCLTLVIGGTKDKIVTAQAPVEIAEGIPDCKLCMYDGLGHGLYEKAPDFLNRIMDMCR